VCAPCLEDLTQQEGSTDGTDRPDVFSPSGAFPDRVCVRLGGPDTIEKRGKMKDYFFCLVSVLLCILMYANFCFPQKLEEIPKKDGGGKDYRFVSSTGFIKVPFELASNHIYLKAEVNDSLYLNFLLDTGAQTSYLDLSKAFELKIKKVDRVKVRRVSFPDDVSFFRLDSIKIGNLTIFEQDVVGLSLSPLSKFEGTTLDGILGYDFLQRFVVEIDYLNQILTIYEPDKFNYTGEGEVLKLDLGWYIPKIQAIVDGEHEEMFEIDTGSRNNLDFSAPFVKEHKFLEKYPKYLEAPLGFGITGWIRGVVGRIGSFQLGNFLIKSPVTGFYLEDEKSFSSLKIAGKIGGGILKKFKVIFDYPHYRMILEKNENYDRCDRYNTSGIQLIQNDKKISVYQVIKDSPAEKAKIKKDDEILSINEVPVSNYSLQELRDILNQEEGTKIELLLKRVVRQAHHKKAKMKKVKLTLKELI
jgi:hypothetical protein